MSEHILLSDTQSIESKHSGRYVASFLYDVGMIQNLISTGFLNIMKDSFSVILSNEDGPTTKGFPFPKSL